MSTTDRDRYITIRASDEERAMLEAIAEADGVTASGLIRQFIRRTYAERFGKKPAKKGAKAMRRWLGTVEHVFADGGVGVVLEDGTKASLAAPTWAPPDGPVHRIAVGATVEVEEVADGKKRIKSYTNPEGGK